LRLDAEIYAEEDERRKKLVSLKNQADSLFYSYETTLRDNGEFIADDLKVQALAKVTELKAATVDPAITPEAFKQHLEALQETLLAIGASVYQRASELPSDEATTQFHPANGALDLDDYGLENDATVAADYEAVD
jgi:molecular chaperone DnaK